MLKKIKVENAVGLKLAHDHTQILPGKFKGVGFRRGHVVRKNDIPKFLDLGKKELYVLTLAPGEVHEEDAARRIARAVAGRNLKLAAPREGKVGFIAKTFGLLKIKVDALKKINRVGAVILSTRHNHSIVRVGDVVAGTRIIPLFIRETKVARVEEIGSRQGPVIEILPLRAKKVGVLVTGSEILEGRIQDRSADIVRSKTEALGSKVTKTAVVADDPLLIAAEIGRMKKAGCHVIVTTGGLSVDPDDVTLAGIRRSGAEIVFYGTPVLPGAMFAYARLGKTVILGTPACVVHDPVTALDVFLPRVLADDPVSAKDVAPLGHGGFCLRCPVCRYPVCPFGKGG
ncbi:MAG: molybdopterin-binding protein [Proteobacteria bacterium]|nr:molybdopterin-binding protein [Pseudomonadota bacterium]